jgi:hypothetical protein
MGFDFYMVNKPPEAVGYKPELPDRPEWFRFSWRGMEAVFQAMRLANVLEGKTPQPVLPSRTEETAAELESLLATPSSIGGVVPYWKFATNAGWLVSGAECAIIVSGLERCLETDPQSLRPKNWPDDRPLDGYYALLREWIAFNRLASAHGGYRVR